MIIPAKTAVLLGQASSFYGTAFGRIYAKEGGKPVYLGGILCEWLDFVGFPVANRKQQHCFFLWAIFKRCSMEALVINFCCLLFLFLFVFLNQGAHSLFLAFLPKESWGLAAGILCTLRTNDTLF